MLRSRAALGWAILGAACFLGCGDDGQVNIVAGGAGGATGSGGAGSGGNGSGGAGTGGAGGGGSTLTAKECFKDVLDVVGPNYDKFKPVIGSHCKGTNHQDIKGIEKVVFLGDSVTAGTPPTQSNQFYSNVLTDMLKKDFGDTIEMQNCAVWGARVDDLLAGDKQIEKCFPSGTEPKRTLIVMTDGGNDVASWAKDKLPPDQAMAEADKAAMTWREAIDWFYADPARFPAGVFVTFANVYEYTDGTADLSSCPAAQLNGLSGSWIDGVLAIYHLEEQYMKIAVETQTDMIFLLETFCGHGYHNDDMGSQCYRGPNTPRWFDVTCIHPTPEGHAVLADLFYSTVHE